MAHWNPDLPDEDEDEVEWEIAGWGFDGEKVNDWLRSVGLPDSHLSLYEHPKEKIAEALHRLPKVGA